MFDVEAARLREILLGRGAVSPLLNLGSSTRHYREQEKPHIQRELFEPLAAAGVAVVHSDLKQADGVDLAGDILDPAVQRVLKARGFKCLLLANLLEHVRDRAAVAAACEAIVGPGGLILATVPSSYPYHADPIDNGWRPSPAGLAGLFGGSRPLLLEEVSGVTYAEELKARGSSVAKALAQTLLSGLIAIARPKGFAARVDRWRWYRKRFRVSIALLVVR
jgi:2-polyprenyl-3-methyl-5-hydroxy-6-metoxy-1,4-benzoquinol methylase